MTREERRFPDKINGSRKKRIAAGSGTQIQDVNRVLKQHAQMQKMMKKVTAKGGMQKMMRAMGGMRHGWRRPVRRRWWRSVWWWHATDALSGINKAEYWYGTFI